MISKINTNTKEDNSYLVKLSTLMLVDMKYINNLIHIYYVFSIIKKIIFYMNS